MSARDDEGDDERALLAGVIVQRVDLARELAVLRLRAPGATFFLMMASGRPAPLVGIARTKPFKGAGLFTAPESAVPLGEKLRARSRLEGRARRGPRGEADPLHEGGRPLPARGRVGERRTRGAARARRGRSARRNARSRRGSRRVDRPR
jgi:hypothetical protein